MIIDCTQCTMREIACSDCVVTHMLAMPPLSESPVFDLDAAEASAFRVLHGAGLVPALRLVSTDVAATG